MALVRPKLPAAKARKEIVELLKRSRHISLILHERPDGDAIGSALALAKAGEQLGKKVEIVCASAIPTIFETIVGPINCRSTIPSNADLIILLDCGELHRSGFGRQLTTLAKKKPIAVVDHHKFGDLSRLTSLYHQEDQATSTTALIYDYLSALHLPIDPPLATYLLLGLYTDTGGFQHANTTGQTFALASRLIRYGANLPLISRTFCRQLSTRKQKLWGLILSDLKISRLGLISAVVAKEQLISAEATAEDVSGLANILALTSEARAALVLIETNDGWRGSLRTRHAHIDIGRLAKLLGGKGQKKAAGFVTTKNIFSGKIEN